MEKHKKCVIVGGRGQMGSLFATWLKNDYHIAILDWDNRHDAASVLAEAEVVIFSVPLTKTEQIIAEYAAFFHQESLLCDISSVKSDILDTMLQKHVGPVVSLHPMFGPGVSQLQGQTVIVCAGRHHERANEFLSVLRKQRAILVECDAAEHDQMMAVVQAVRHFATFALGSFLASEQIDVSRSLDFASPVYRLEIDMVSRLLAQDAALYVDIMLASSERQQLIAKLAQHYAELALLVADNNRDALLQKFGNAQKAFASEAARALQESNHIISVLAEQVDRGKTG